MNEPLYVLARPRDLDANLRALRATVVGTREAVHSACNRRRSVWVAPGADLFGLFKGCPPLRAGDQRLLLLGKLRGQQHAFLNTMFRVVVSMDDTVRRLPREELLEVLATPNRDELFIGGVVDAEDGVVTLYRGNLEPLVVPLEWFKVSGKGVRPDPARLDITDFGHTVRLGAYEAATHAILYEHDSDYRRRAKARVLEQDKSFGGALRRLRLLKGLSLSDFPGVTEKEVARIEKNLVKKPHADTMAILAKRLGVKADEIKTY
jgi:hypothetical protein